MLVLLFGILLTAEGNTEPIPKPEIRVSRDEITEGYNMSISCHIPTPPGESPGLQFALYRDGTILYQFSSASEWHISPAQTEQLAYYTCAVRPSKREGEQRSASVYIHMQEVILGPVLNVNQNPITEGDTLSLTCGIQGSWYGNNAQLQLKFYKMTNGHWQSSSTHQQFQLLHNSLSSEYRVPSVRVQHSGEYACVAATLDNRVTIWSSPITIKITEMFSKPELRVSSNPITEGSALTLTCGTTTSTVSTRELQFAFYWDGQELQGFTSSNQHRVYSVQLLKSGNYKCAVQHPATGISKASEESYIRVVEMFSKPELRVSPNPITEGSALTLTCGTTTGTVSIQELQFAFYLEGQSIRRFTSSKQYRVYLVQLEDSGNYKCAVQHPTTGISKASEESYIQVEEMFSKPKLRVSSNPITEGSALTLTCGTTAGTVSTRELQFAFYWDGQIVQGFTSSNQYRAYLVQLQKSGKYKCAVQHPATGISKASEESYIWVVGGAVRPVVSLSPKWANILTGDKVTLTCDVGSTAGTAPRYSWYKDNKKTQSYGQKFTFRSALKTDSGTYQCQTDTSERSEPVSLSVTDGPLILQAPPYVYEGDSLAMRCYSESGGDTMFYKDNNPVAPTYSDELHIKGVNMTVTGTYRCSKKKTYRSGEVFISVRELFSRPEIKVRPSPLAEGSNMTITCDTALHPSRITTPLLFAFYINGNTVRDFSLSRIYRVYSVGPGDWGEYSCAVRTPTGTVLKLSNVTQIQIHAKSMNLLLSVGLPLLVILIVIIAVGIYKLKHKIGQTKPYSDQSNTGIPLSETPAVAKDEEPVYHQIHTGSPPAEQDVCYTYIDVHHLKKSSPAPPPNPNNNEIIYSQVMPSK